MVSFHESFTESDLERHIVGMTVPSVLYFAEQKALIDSLSIKEHVLVFVNSGEGDPASRGLIDEVTRVSPSFHGRLLFIVIEDTDLSILQYFNMKPVDLPQVVLVNMVDEESTHKYIMTSQFAVDVQEMELARR